MPMRKKDDSLYKIVYIYYSDVGGKSPNDDTYELFHTMHFHIYDSLRLVLNICH